MNKNIRKAINWNDPSVKFYDDIYNKQMEQIWLPEEIPVGDDKDCYNNLEPILKEAYDKILAGLTLLDTEQTVGITYISKAIDNLFQKSVLTLFAGFETIHARSYSTIFQTLCTNERIEELFEWIEETQELQNKVTLILDKYVNAKEDEKHSIFMALIGSLCLEGICFYSGFYLPLLLAGQGTMVHSGEIINLILRDERLHTVGVGHFAKELYQTFSPSEQEALKKDAIDLIVKVYEQEIVYSKLIYKDFDESILEDVIRYIEFNVDYSLEKAGFEKMFNISESQINPIVMNGYSLETKTHDFFSTKGNGYIKTTNVEQLDDDDFGDIDDFCFST